MNGGMGGMSVMGPTEGPLVPVKARYHNGHAGLIESSSAERTFGPMIQVRSGTERWAWRLRLLFRGRPVYFSTLKCPHCGRLSRDQMPSNASVYFYQCLRCRTIFKPRPKHCCVYCSYGDVPCPSAQRSYVIAFKRPIQETGNGA
jgi:hypothetical protein